MPPFNTVEALGQKYHSTCLQCQTCNKALAKLVEGFVVHSDKPYCMDCSKKYQEKELEVKALAAGNVCTGCSKPIVTGSYLELPPNEKWHPGSAH
jgi:hypothetical protein